MPEEDRKLSPKLASARKNWEERKLNPSLKRGKERKPSFVTSSGIEIKREYDPEDLNGFDFVDDLGFPGEYPFTRGVQPTMYRGRLWTMRQYAGFGTAEESNRRYRYLFEQGQTGLSVAFDLPTQMGRDADHPLARGEVGRVGVSICSLADMETLLAEAAARQDFDLDDDQLDRLDPARALPGGGGAARRVVGQGQRHHSERRAEGIRRARDLHLSAARLDADHHGHFRIRDQRSSQLEHDFDFRLPHPRGRLDRGAGTGVHDRRRNRIRRSRAQSGLEVDAFASRLSFFFNVHNNFFEEIAKFRAARRLWAKIMKERFGAKDERSMMMRFHAQTAGSTLTAQQVDNNVVRVTLQALAAVLGGAQSLHTNSKDEALALPTETSALLALRTQQVIAHESDVGDTVDPLGGSYYVERLTTELEKKATEYIARIDDFGGAVAAIERGYMQREIQNAAFIYQREIEKKERIIVGVNQFTGGGEPPGDILRVKPEVEEQQRQRVAKVRAERNREAAEAAIARVEAVANNGENLMPPIVDAVRAWCTLGEISDAMRRVFGEYKPVSTV